MKLLKICCKCLRVCTFVSVSFFSECYFWNKCFNLKCLTEPATAFAMEVAEKNRRLKEQSGIDLMEISSDDNDKIESEVEITKSYQYFIYYENFWLIGHWQNVWTVYIIKRNIFTFLGNVRLKSIRSSEWYLPITARHKHFWRMNISTNFFHGNIA